MSLWVSSAIAATGPSFDCSRSQGPVEQAICSDKDLSRLDLTLVATYAKALSQQNADGERLRREQSDWLAYRDATCGPDPMPSLGIGPVTTTTAWRSACLTQLYQERIDLLESLITRDDSVPYQTPDALCSALMPFAPPRGAVVDSLDAVDILATHAGKALVIDPPPSEGLSIERLDLSAGQCPAIQIYQSTGSRRVIIKPPSDIGGYCGEIPIDQWPNFSIADISGTQALLARSGPYLQITKRNPDGWGSTCAMRLALSVTYSVTSSTCSGSDCNFLQHAAPRLADFIRLGTEQILTEDPTAGLVALWNSAPSPADVQQWTIMRRIGLASVRRIPFQGVDDDGIKNPPYYDDQTGMTRSSYNGIETPGLYTAFVPIKSGDELLLGKIGPKGWGCCNVSTTELLSVYRLTGNQLSTVASFVLDPSGLRLAFAEEN